MRLSMLIVVFMMFCGFSDSQAIKAIIGEAESEGYQGMLAVACALRNRGTLEGVYGANSKRVREKLYPKYVHEKASKAWAESIKRDVVNGATHWESTDFKRPYWADSMREVARIGKHIFYK